MQKVFENIIKALAEKRDEAEKNMELSDVLSEVNSYGGMFDAFDKSIEIINQTAAEYNNGWIPCDGVHFPEENVYVRVTTWTETEKIGFRRDGKWFVYGSDGMAEATVLAWQPTQPFQPKGE